MHKSPALRRYNYTVLGLSLAYMGALFGIVALFRTRPPHGALAYAAAILPALPLVGIFLAWGRYLTDEPDEYIRMLTIRQTLIATGFMLSATTTWGFLESFGLAVHIPAYAAGILWFAGLMLGGCVNIFAVRTGRS